jgi:hypothetical protein
MGTEATLSAKVTADIADFNKKFGELHRTIEGVGKAPGTTAAATSSAADSIEQSTGRWGAAFAAVGTAVAAGALMAIDKIGEWTRATAEAAEKVEQISQQTGIAQTTLEQWSVALNRTGTDTDVFAKAFKALSKDIEKARGEADFSKTKFAEMGLTLHDLGNTETVIRAVADRIAAMTDPAERARFATDLLGKAGMSLLPAFSQGSAGLDAAGKKAQDFGLVLSASARTDLLKYDDAIDDLGKAWQGFQTKVGAAAAPILTKGVELAEASIVMSGKIVDSIVRMVEGVRSAFATLGQLMDGVREKTDAVKEYFRSLYDAVVGHSYIPDMVDEIGRHMQNLDVAMTAPARNATVATAKIFEGLAFTTQDAMNQVVSTINFAWGSATQGVSQALAQMTTAQVNWAQVGIQIGQQFLSAMINQIISLMTQWALAAVFGQKAHTAMETAKTAATVAGNAARLGTTLATNKAMLASVTTTIAGFGAVGNAAMAVMAAALEGVVAFMMAVAASVSYVPIVGQALAGTIIVGATKAQIVGAAAIIAATAALNVALGGATVAATTALATPLASGGIVTGPTFALIGEAGPEAVIPLSRAGGFGDRRPTHVHVHLNGREIALAVADDLPGALRTMGVPA